MRNQRHTLLVVAFVVVGSIAAVSGGAAAATALAVDGEQADDGSVTVTVTQNNTAVANASVRVEALNNSTYAGVGNHTAGENGTVGLPAPEQNVTVRVTASTNTSLASTTLSLAAAADEENASGGDENDSQSFGILVSNYVHALQDEGNVSGQTIADFVTSNNPGADHRPEHAGPGDEDGENGEAGANGNGQGNGSGDDKGPGNNGHEPGNSPGQGNGPGNGNGSGNGNGPGNGSGPGNAPGNNTESGDE